MAWQQTLELVLAGAMAITAGFVFVSSLGVFGATVARGETFEASALLPEGVLVGSGALLLSSTATIVRILEARSSFGDPSRIRRHHRRSIRRRWDRTDE